MIQSRRIGANGLSFMIDEAGEGDTVALCLHGFPESRSAWRPLLPELAGFGWHAVAPDLRGYGESDRPTGRTDYEIERLTDDVAALFDALGARRRILIGHDWGGIIAWVTAIQARTRLDGLVILNAPHPQVFDAVLRTGWRQRLRSWYVLFFMLPWLPEAVLGAHNGAVLARALSRQSSRFPPGLIAEYRRNIAVPGAAKAMITYYRSNIRRLSDLRARIAIPTLMIWGEQDVALDIALTRGNEAWVVDFTLRLLPGASHWVQEDAPDDVLAAIATWASLHGLAQGG